MIRYTEQLKHIYKNTIIPDFLNLVKVPTSDKCYCVHYDNSTDVKPFFDLDMYHPDNEYDIQQFINRVGQELGTTDAVWATNHRDNKLSFHVIFNGIKTTTKDLLKLALYLNIPELDTSVYKGSRILRFSNQIKTGTNSVPVLYGDISDFVIVDVDNCESYECPYDIKVSINKRTLKRVDKQVESQLNTVDEFKPNTKQLKLINNMLDALPVKYSEDKELWFNIGCSLHNYSDSLFKTWVKFSKRSTIHTNCDYKNWWEFMNKDVKHPITISRLINYYISEFPENNKSDLLKVLSRPVKFNRLNNITTLKKLDIKTTDLQFISDLKKNKEDYKLIRNNKNVFIKAPTGSGKTTLITDYLIKKKLKIIVLTSRVSLADCLADLFTSKLKRKISHYQKDKVLSLLDVVCQIDSLDKIDVDKIQDNEEPFILVLDEFNSLMNHFLNPLDKMYRSRITFLQKFFKLSNLAEQVFLSDYDLTTTSIKFYLQNNESTKNILIINEPSGTKDTPITFYDNLSSFKKQMINDIENDIPFFCCSDTCGVLYSGFIEPLKKKYPNKKILDYSAINGDSEFTTLDTKWEDAFIFCTPRIIYGIDYNKSNTHKVYSFNRGKTINVSSINQQIGRIRQPISINIFLDSTVKRYNEYHTLEQFEKDINTFKDGCELKFKEYTNDDILITTLKQFWLEYRFNNYILGSFYKYHLTNFFRDKKYTNIKTDDTKTQFFIIEHLTPEEQTEAGQLSDNNPKHFEIKQRRKDILEKLGYQVHDETIYSNGYMFNEFINYHNLLNNKPTGNTENIFETFYESKTNMYELFIKAHKELNIPLLGFNKDTISDNKMSDTLYKNICKVYGLRVAQVDWKVMSKMYYKLLGTLCDDVTFRTTVNGKRKSHKIMSFNKNRVDKIFTVRQTEFIDEE